MGLIAGFIMLGSPSGQRQIGADLRRVEDLRRIANRIHARMPAHPPDRLEQLGIPMRDPVSNQPYGYRVIQDTRYELCAEFSASNSENPVQDSYSVFGKHGAGKQCFELHSDRSSN